MRRSGLGGHALEIAQQLTTGRLIGLDRDAQALEIARERLKEFERQVTLVHANFSRVDEVVRELGWTAPGRRARGLGGVKPAAGHRGAGLFVSFRRAARYAHGFG